MGERIRLKVMNQFAEELSHKICFYMNVRERRPEVRKPCGNLP